MNVMFSLSRKLEEGVSSGINMTVLSIAYGIFTPEELAKTEKAILSGLKFEILVASARSFSDYFKQAVPCHPQMTQLADVCHCIRASIKGQLSSFERLKGITFARFSLT
jgi:hypothetical protein